MPGAFVTPRTMAPLTSLCGNVALQCDKPTLPVLDGLRRGLSCLVLVIDVTRNTARHRASERMMVRVVAGYTADHRAPDATFRVSWCTCH